MRICDIPEDQIHAGIKVRGMKTGRIGTIVGRDDRVPGRDPYWWVQFDGEDKPTSGFFWNDCECEVVDGTFQSGEKS